MRNSIHIIARRPALILVTVVSSIAGAMLAAPVVAGAQGAAAAPSTGADHRWDAWAGCWVPELGPSAEPVTVAVSGTSTVPEVCVRPVGGTSAADFVTIVRDSAVHTTRIDADGVRHAVARTGCTGGERAQWSPTGARVYLQADVTCGTGERVTSGLIAMSRTGEWIDVQGVSGASPPSAGVTRGVGVTRYEMVDDTTAAARPAEAAASSMAARWVPEQGATIADVVDASRHLDAPVIQAWLMQLDEGFVVDANALTTMAKAKVAPDVIDLVVAISFPDRFSVDPVTNQASLRPADESTADSVGYYGFLPYGYSYDPFFADEEYEPFGLGVYGHFYGRGYGGGSIVVVKQGAAPTPPGHVVNGRGYAQNPGSSGNSGTATPASSPAPAPSTSRSSGSTPSAPPPAAPRTAIPKPPGE